MASTFDSLSLSCVVAGLMVVVLSSSFLSQWQIGIPIAMEFWTAAGLLQLAGEPSWTRIMMVAVIVAVRRLILSRRMARLP
jgi:hypothetical protein